MKYASTSNCIRFGSIHSFEYYFRKVYTTENAYRSHVNSKKHRENEIKAALKPKETPTPAVAPSVPTEVTSKAPPPETVQEDAEVDDEDGDEEMQTIDQKIAASRNRLSPTSCLFCPTSSPSLELNLDHMASSHSFFIPEADFLIDLPGLLTYLGDKVSVGNVCLYCNGKGRELRSLEAVRKHMLDKSHCKIAYDSQKDQLELSDFYDFSSSYPVGFSGRRRAKKAKKESVQEEDEEWEADEGSGNEDVDEVVEVTVEDEEDSEEEPEENPLTYGDTPYELVLPSGARIGHRSMRRYYVQNFHGRGLTNPEDPNSGAALVRKLIADKNSALVPTKGGFGAFGSGTEVVKARNRGEAKEAGRHVREHRDQQRREQFKTKIGFVHNSQKHYRDPLLQ